MNFQDFGNVGGWTLNSLVLNTDESKWYCVGTSSNVGEMPNKAMQPWSDQGNLGGWTLKMLAFGGDGSMWCVGTAGNFAKWVNGSWVDQAGGWTLKMITFDLTGVLWCVGTEGNVGKWNGNGWVDQGRLGGWTLDWIQFRKGDVKEVYCVGTEHNLGKYEFDTKAMNAVNTNWALKMLTFSDDGEEVHAVGTLGNVGYSTVG